MRTSRRREIALPGPGSAVGFEGRRDDTFTFYGFTSFTDPGTIYKYDIPAGTSGIYFRPELTFDPDRFETRQVFYPSRDGTRIPMFIVHRRGLTLDGSNPTLLYAYNGFNHSLGPSFSTAASSCWSRATCSRRPICAVEVSMARTGTRPA